MDPNALLAGRTRETAIRRDASGRWWNGEDRIDHPNLVRAFDAWLDVAEDGRYCLKNDINWAYVAIEGAPLFVRSVSVDRDPPRLTLSDATEEALDVASLRQGADGALYCDAREGRLSARFDRAAAQALEPLLDEDDEGVFLKIGGDRIRPPVVDDPLKNE
jgi:hypothetical protein